MKGKECLSIVMMITVLWRNLVVQGPYFEKHWSRFDHWKAFKMVLSVAHEKMKSYRF